MSDALKGWVPRWQVEWRVGITGWLGQRRTKYFPDTDDGAFAARAYAARMERAGHHAVRARAPNGRHNSARRRQP